jgi:EAL domain-containing protein (putative c-di-GMP-specific phosphodiesterase class I)/FixJ family two-component response regulator
MSEKEIERRRMSAKLIDDIRNWFRSGQPVDDAPSMVPSDAEPLAPAVPTAFAVDDDEGICKVISTTLASMGVETRTFHNAKDAVAALDESLPSIIFLDVALEGSDAIDVIRGLGERGFGGVVQLISGSNIALLEDVARVGARHGLTMRPPLEKPFRAEAIRTVVSSLRLDHRPGNVEVRLDEAIANNWLELWYQPKIDLRTSTLAGAEGLSRCRHPVHGTLTPGSFLPGGSEQDHAALTEHVITTALRDWNDIADLGVNLHTAVNTSIGALANLQLPALIREYRPKSDKWPGLILEITESEVVKNVAFMHEIATQLRIYGITLAIDDFGEGFSSFARLRQLPFAEMKLDMSFVKGCGTDLKSAGICQAIINLAHHFGAVAVAEGIENATDLQAIHRMGCDLGQGFFLARPMPKANFLTLLRQRELHLRAS